MLPPLLAWGLLSRGLAIVYAISFISIALQIRSLAGRRGIAPFASTMRQIRHDFPDTHAFYFPSLFWLTGASDMALLLVPIGGALCALCWSVGWQSDLGESAIMCWLAMRTLDLPVGLLYPWDSLLLEAGALAVFLPVPPLASSTLAMTRSVHPWVAAAFRWLLARLMLGFGKKKFIGTSSNHSCYIKNFLVAQPLPSPLGWLGCRIPLPMFQGALLVMFAVECVAPFFLLPAGGGRVVAACCIGALMAGIQAGGNFGHFNVLTIVLCLGCLDSTSSVFDELPPLVGKSVGELCIRSCLLAHTAVTIIFLPFDSWCTNAWAYWPQLAIARKAWVRRLLTLCRFASDQRLVHAYGVFPPTSNPPMRMAPVLEGSHDGVTWRRYAWRYLPCDPKSRPRFVAPFHPRLDHSLFYVSFGTGPENFLCTINSARPYAFGRDSMLHRLAHALLGGASAEVRSLFGDDPFPANAPPPSYIRARLMVYEPLSVSDAAASGAFWAERCIDEVHMPTMARATDASAAGDTAADGKPGRSPLRRRRLSRDRQKDVHVAAAGAAATHVMPPLPPPLAPGSRDPLLFHPDLMPVWRGRCPKLRRLVAISLSPSSLDLDSIGDALPAPKTIAHHFARLCVADYSGGDNAHAAALADRFWDAFVPAAARCPMSRWDGKDGLLAMSARLQSEFDPSELHGCALILGGLTMRMMIPLERMHLQRSLKKLGGPAPSYFHLVLLAHTIVLSGANSTSALLLDSGGGAGGRADDDVERVAGSAKLVELTERGMAFYGLLYTEMMLFHARKHVVAHEMMRKYSDTPLDPRHPCLIPGFIFLLPTISAALQQRVAEGQHGFPQWVPPPPFGDWQRA